MAGPVFQRKSLFKIPKLHFSSEFNLGCPRKLKPRFVLWSFFLQRLFCISLTLPHDLAWNIFAMSELVHRAVGPSIAASIEPLVHHANPASSSLVYKYCFGRYLYKLDKLVWRTYSECLCVIYIDCMIFLSPFLDFKKLLFSHSWSLEFSACNKLSCMLIIFFFFFFF